ncbi:hypothetical protein MMC14_004364 [Varicellaria rhodocarpa]|nr:hypothetical protein [Varicellaria rhodocarpa]
MSVVIANIKAGELSALKELRNEFLVAIFGRMKPMALYAVPNLPDQQIDGSFFARTNGSRLRIVVERVYDILKTLRDHITNDPILTLSSNL